MGVEQAMNENQVNQGIESDIYVSFLMTCYNFAPYIAEAVNSLLQMDTDRTFEVVVIDDASTDGSWDILSGIADPRLKIVRHEVNRGPALSVDELFTLARGKFIARLDGDDRWRPNFLNVTLPILESEPNVGMVYGDVALINSLGSFTSASNNLARPNIPNQGNEFFHILETNYICAPAVIARREAWDEVLPWPLPKGPGDWRGHMMMALAGWDFAYVNLVLADYRVHAAGMHSTYLRNNDGEESTDLLLDEMFEIAHKKISQKQKNHIRARHHQRLAFGYISQYRFSDARRLIFSAIRARPGLLLERIVAKQFFGLIVGYGNYQWLKKKFRSRPDQ